MASFFYVQWHDFLGYYSKILVMEDKNKKKDNLEQKAEAEQQKHHAAVKPDPETMGPNPQENMEGPVSSIIKNIAESGDDEVKEDKDNKDKKKKDDKA